METKHKELIIRSVDPTELKGKFLNERLYRKWNEDFVDEDTGETVSIERKEVLFEKGSLIDNDLLSQMNFYIQSGDITEVAASNIQREAYEAFSTTTVWVATIQYGKKTYNYYLYACSVINAREILIDYLEQTLSDYFVIKSLRSIDYSNLIPSTDQSDESEFYQIEIEVAYENEQPIEHTYTIQATDAENAKELIIKYMITRHKERNSDQVFETTILSAKTLKCSGIIPYSFSMEHIQPE